MSSDKTTLGTRMKEYEHVTKHTLIRRTPVVIRLDGKAFHTFTKKIKPTNDPSLSYGPFSEKLHNVMINTTTDLCNNIQNARIGYTQSDEISILLTDWQNLNTDQWFNGNIQKIVSVSASMATAYFNHYFKQEFGDIGMAFFDSRVFNIPKEEVNNYFIWRQQDASRNSVQMLGHHFFSQKAMHGKNNNQVQDMLMLDKQINWNDLATWKKRGTCYHPRNIHGIDESAIDENIPIFTQQRIYLEAYIN